MKRLMAVLSLLMFSPCLLAEAKAATAEGPGLMGNFLVMALIFAVVYFMVIRPQTKRVKEHQKLVSSITKDDEVVTSGGLIGKVVKVTDQFVQVSLAEGIEVTVQKQAIAGQLPKGTLKNI